jgi:hypothetical protein
MCSASWQPVGARHRHARPLKRADHELLDAAAPRDEDQDVVGPQRPALGLEPLAPAEPAVDLARDGGRHPALGRVGDPGPVGQGPGRLRLLVGAVGVRRERPDLDQPRRVPPVRLVPHRLARVDDAAHHRRVREHEVDQLEDRAEERNERSSVSS